MTSTTTSTGAMGPLELERAAWQALATEGAAAGFFAEVLADDVLILMPGGMVIDDRDAVVASMGGPPWSSFELSDERIVSPTDDCTVVAYPRAGPARRSRLRGADREHLRPARRGVEARGAPTHARRLNASERRAGRVV